MEFPVNILRRLQQGEKGEKFKAGCLSDVYGQYCKGMQKSI